MGHKKKIDTVQVALETPAYQQSYQSVAENYKVDFVNGLSEAEAKARLNQYGQNKLDGDSGVSLIKVLLRQCTNAMGLVLVLAMALSYGVNDYVEGGVITAVIVLNITVGVFQEYRAEQTIDTLRSLSSPTAAVLRDGVVTHIPSLDVVPGDVVVVKTGDVVPADLRLIETMNFETDEALLTGESLPVLKEHELVFPEDVGVGDRINLAYSSSTVTKGRARGIAISTAMATEIGRIAASLSGKKRKAGRSMNAKKYGPMAPVKGLTFRIWDGFLTFLGLNIGTPLQQKLSILAYSLLVFACILALIVFGVNNFNASHEVAIYAISLGIAVIPESLIAVLTITMAVSMRRMAKKKVIVRKLDALEALGGVSNICSDKTGTLTQGKMLTRKAWLPGVGVYSLTDSRSSIDPTSGIVTFESYSPTDEDELSPVSVSATVQTYVSEAGLDEDKSIEVNVENALPPVTSELATFLEAGALCNISDIRYDSQKKEWIASGDPTEIAIQVFSHRFSYGKPNLMSQGWTQLAEYPFDSDVKRMSVIFEGPSPGKYERGVVSIFTKGAVERVLDLCTSLGNGEYHEAMTDAKKEDIMETVSEFASQGLRVLAIARRVEVHPKASYLDFGREHVEKDLTLLGLVGLYDPPRLETKDAVAECKAAGIKVHMLTGDHPGTAEAIARDVGIIPRDLSMLSAEAARSLVMTAAQFDQLTDDEVDKLQVLPRVIARCAPNTKVRMIEALHRRRAYAAMTGDGVNDSPSLKMSDVGIAMGMAGSDVAKAASDLVLTDDNFSSIVAAIEEGRRMFDNIQKFILHLLIANVAEVLLLVVGLAFKDNNKFSVFPLAPLQILWVNMVTSPGPAFGLSLEPAVPEVMNRPPQNPRKGIFTWEVLVDTFVYGVIMGVLLLANFCIIIYGTGDGNLGHDCNQGYNDSCEAVFRARSVMFGQIIWLILITAWELKSLRNSMFRLDPADKSRFTFFKDMYQNKVLFWSVVIFLLSVFPIVHIPRLNDDVFMMKPITWEWSLLAEVTVIYVAGIELWKMLKRRKGWFAVPPIENSLIESAPTV
ncbi:hypothetical protein V1512DRAFT_257811 [Lipomyces arxii]|uniref:uncharacterized protein n=1 Tax=Lipomyces arxii TaxID=56418 RepID=UPI0034CDC8A3